MAWNAFEVHITVPVKKLLKEMRIDEVLFPGGCTKHIQVPSEFWNKFLKELRNHNRKLFSCLPQSKVKTQQAF